MTDCRLAQSSFAAARLVQCAFDGSDLNGADFERVHAASISLYQCVGAQLRFADAVLEEAIFSQARFEQANFSRAMLNMAVLAQAHMPDANFAQAQLRYADCTAFSAPRASFVGADVTGLNAHAADFSHANWAQANLQDIQPPDTERLAAEQWPNPPRQGVAP